jgi:hypothetical protein
MRTEEDRLHENMRDDIATVIEESSMGKRWAVTVIPEDANTIDLTEYDGELRARLTIEFY